MARFAAYDDSDASSSDGGYAETRETVPRPPVMIHEASDSEDEDEPEPETMYESSPEVDVEGADEEDEPMDTVQEPDIPWAQKMRMEPHKLHVMQTSLFRTKELNKKHPRDPVEERLPLVPPVVERSSFARDVAPPLHRPPRKYARIQTKDSVVNSNEGSFVDAGLALGKSFRVSWGPGGQLAYLGKLCGPTSTIPPQSSTAVTVARIPMFSENDEAENKKSNRLLEAQLKATSFEKDENELPVAFPKENFRFLNFSSLFSREDHSPEATVWRLCHAAFDEIHDHLPDTADAELRSQVQMMRSKAAVSTWLAHAVEPNVERDLRAEPSASVPRKAFLQLTGNQVSRACETAVAGDYVRLATLIAQSGGDDEFRQDLVDQLVTWREQRTDAHIEPHVRKIYSILAGIVDVLPGSKGHDVERCPDEPIAQGMDWKRTLGLYLWHAAPMEDSLPTAFSLYEAALRDKPSLAASPVPWYTESDVQRRLQIWKSSSTPARDACFELLKVATDPAYPLDRALYPTAFSQSPLDLRMTWHIFILLSRVLRRRDFSDRQSPGMDVDEADQGDEGISVTADLVTTSYALHLERLGAVQEAAFVLMHLQLPDCRVKAIKELLIRQAALLDEWRMPGLQSMQIPATWIHEAKACLARYEHRSFDAYELFMAAGAQRLAHHIATHDLAPEAILRDDTELLRGLFKNFDPAVIDGWSFAGGLFMDYVDVLEHLPQQPAFRLTQDASSFVRDEEEQDVVPDAVEASRRERLRNQARSLLRLLPDLLRDRNDVRQKAALDVMIRNVMMRVRGIESDVAGRLGDGGLVGAGVRMRHVRMTAHNRFLDSIGGGDGASA